MLDWTGSSHQEGVLLWELGLGWGASLNWDETLLTRDVSAGAAGASDRPKSDLAAMCWRHSSWGTPARALSLGCSAAGAAPCTPTDADVAVLHPAGSRIPRGPTWYSKVVSAAPSGPRAARRSFSRCLAWRRRQKAAAAAMAMPATQASAMKVSSTEWKPSPKRDGRE